MPIEVLRAGALTTVQDLGRAGFAQLGIPRSGAADRNSLRLANRLVGNDEGAAALECTLIGPSLLFHDAAVIAVTGATVGAKLNGEEITMNLAVEIDGGSVLELATASAGLRSYIAVRGGIDTAVVMGSRSSDLLSGLGPPPITGGELLKTGPPLGSVPAIGVAPVEPPRSEPLLHLFPGPRDDWFSADALALLCSTVWQVSSDSNRSGARLSGPPLERVRDASLLSEGVVEGSIQVPSSGQPIILLADHPTTGGYPVIAVIVSDEIPAAAQLRPGQRLRFALSFALS